MGCLGSLFGFFIGFGLLSAFPAVAALDGDPTLLYPAIATAVGAVLLVLPGSRDDQESAFAGMARGLFAGGLIGMLMTASFFGLGPF